MFWIQDKGKKNNSSYCLYYAETVDDIQKLPTDKNVRTQDINNDSTINDKCSIGSECLCIGNGNLYVLTSSGWKMI